MADIKATPGNDLYYNGTPGNDVIQLFEGNDYSSGASGDDVMFGGPGDDALDGGFDRDFLYGNEGNDFLSGSEGDDDLIGGAGVNYLTGGFGSDNFIITSQTGELDIITDFGFGGTDKILVSRSLFGPASIGQFSFTDNKLFYDANTNDIAPGVALVYIPPSTGITFNFATDFGIIA